MARVVTDGMGISYHDPTTENPRVRGHPELYRNNPRQSLTVYPWNGKVIEATATEVFNTVFKICLAHQEDQQDEMLRFREVGQPLSYIHHILLPRSAGAPGEAITRIQITGGGDTSQYGPGMPYCDMGKPAMYYRTMSFRNGACCINLKFKLEPPGADDEQQQQPSTDLAWAYQLSPHRTEILSSEWMDSVQLRFLHGSATRYLCLALRITETRYELVDGVKMVKPMLFEIVRIKESDLSQAANIFSIDLKLFLRLKANAGEFELPRRPS